MRKATRRVGLGVLGAGLMAMAVAHAAGATEISFRRVPIDRAFRSEGVAVADLNGDGKQDIVVGSAYYAAPDWKMCNIVDQPKVFSPETYSDVFCCFTADVNSDGRIDVITVPMPGEQTSWLENPGKANTPWNRRAAVAVTNNESPIWADVSGGGRNELVFGYSPDAANPDSPQRRMAFAGPGKTWSGLWPIRTISAANTPGSQRFSHGLGVGDINRDGRNDVVIREGWWEQPADTKLEEWPFHPAPLGAACAQMLVYDFDGDGDNDVLSSSAHAFGIWWHEQTADGWKTHTIDDTYSQTHAICLADINGDGLPDFVTGKRWWAHMGHDPGSDMPAVLMWYELTRKDGRPSWVRHQIDNDSGVGTQFEVADVNGDKLPDIVVSNKKGVYYFEQVRK